MAMFRNIFVSVYLVCAAVFFFNNTGNAAAPEENAPDREYMNQAPAGAAPDAAAPEIRGRISALSPDIIVRAPETELSASALETYCYLLFVQAILDEDESALLDAAPLLSRFSANPAIWLDGGVWLMSRKSPNSVPFLELATKALPDDLSLTLLYAEALGDNGLAPRGISLLRDFLQRHPKELEARLELAMLLVKDKQFDEAQKIFNAIPVKQRTPLVDYYQAQALMGMDKRAEAIPYLRKTVKAMPDFVEALADLAFAFEKEGNYREARSTYDKLRKLNFSPPEVALRLVNLSLRLKQPERALQYIRQGPNTIPFRLNAANLLLESRHYLQAENILKQLAENKNAPPEVFMLLADVVYEQRRNLKMAFSWLDKIPPDSPAAERAAVLRIQLYAESGQTARALEETDTALARHPESRELLDFKIRLLAREKKLPEALALAREAAAKWPDNNGMLFLLGSLLDESGDKKSAMAIMEKILETQPENFQALNYVGFTLAEENRDLERALRLLRKADELSPNQAYIIDSLAWALHKAGHRKDALTQIRRAINLGGPPDPAIWEHYGDIAASAGRRDEARRAYRKAIELKPANVENIRGRLSRL